MRRALTAAAVYFAVVFSFAFLAGVLRTLLLAPRTGETAAVLMETPLVLLVSWLAAVWSIRRWAVPAAVRARLAMGLVAFALLMAVETALAGLLFGRPLAQQIAAFATPAGAIGLLAQVAFGLIPLAVSRRA